MVDVKRLREVAWQRRRDGRAGMIMTIDQVLLLIARGDARVAAYEVRIEELLQRIAFLEGLGGPLPHWADGEGRPPGVPEGYVLLAKAAEMVGMTASNLGKLAAQGRVPGVKVLTMVGNGRRMHMWYVSLEEAEAYAGLSWAERKLVRGGLRAVDVAGGSVGGRGCGSVGG